MLYTSVIPISCAIPISDPGSSMGSPPHHRWVYWASMNVDPKRKLVRRLNGHFTCRYQLRISDQKMCTRTLGGSSVYTLVNKHSSMDHVPTCCRSNYYLKMMTRVIAMLVCPRVFFFMAMFNQGVGRCFQHKLQLLISKDIIYYTILYIHILEMYNHVYKSGCF